MKHIFQCMLLILICSPFSNQAYSTESGSQANAILAGTISGLVPLPGSCGRTLPANSSNSVCCISGYVFLDGDIVADAHVTIRNLSVAGNPTLEVWSRQGPDSPLPYYLADLGAAPLNVQPGHTIGILVEYSSHTFFTTYTTQPGGQQFDLVIPHNGAGDYVFERQIWSQSPVGTFNMHNTAVATDGANTIYVADWANARIQVFNKDGQFLRAWERLVVRLVSLGIQVVLR